MGDLSTENNEFQFYLLLVRQYIFQLPEEDERVRAAAWMVHLRRLRDAKDLKLRNDYIKLLLFAMHSRCLIGPFAQPPQKDKGLEHFPKNFTFAEMMRHLIEESKAQSIRYCQPKHEDQLPFASGEHRVQEKLEDTVSLPAVSLPETQTYQRNFENNIRPTDCKERIVSDTSWRPGLTSDSNKFSPDFKVENLTKVMDENRKEYQSIKEDASEKTEEGIKSTMGAGQEPQLMKNTALPLYHSQEEISINNNSLTSEEKEKRAQMIYGGELYNNNPLRNSRHFTDTLKTNIQSVFNRDQSIDEKNIINEVDSPFKYSEHSHYQHCYHHHYHKSPNGQKISPLEMAVTGRKYIGQIPPQIPLNGGMIKQAKQDFSVNCGHSCYRNDLRDTRINRENSTCSPKDNLYYNLGTNPSILNYQTDYDSHTTSVCNHQAQENCSSSHTPHTVTEKIHNFPLDVNNRKCNDGGRSDAKMKERATRSDETIQKSNEKQIYIPGNGVNTTGVSERQKLVKYDSERIQSTNIKHHSHKEGPKTMTEEPLFPTSPQEMPLHQINDLSINEISTGQRKSAHEMHLQGSPIPMHHTQTKTQDMSNNQRHTQSTEDIQSGMNANAKSSELNVAKFRASLSADLGAYSAGYAAGYSAGYAAGITAALPSPSEQLYSVFQ